MSNEADLKRIVGKQEEELHQAELRIAGLEATIAELEANATDAATLMARDLKRIAALEEENERLLDKLNTVEAIDADSIRQSNERLQAELATAKATIEALEELVEELDPFGLKRARMGIRSRAEAEREK